MLLPLLASVPSRSFRVRVFIAVNCNELTIPRTASSSTITHTGVARPSRPKAAMARPTSRVLATSTVR